MHALSKLLFSLSFLFSLAPSLAAPTEQSSNAKLKRRGYYIDPAGGSPTVPWPKSEIPYCLTDPSKQKAFREVNDKAFKLWTDALKDRSSLKITDYGDCKNAKDDALFISINNQKAARTIVGYQKAGKRGERNSMSIDLADDWGSGSAAANLAHEWGHAFGLYHEHQKPSAWKSEDNSPQLLDFICKNLKDYDQMKKRGENMDELCKSLTAAARAGFSARDFLPYPEISTHAMTSGFDWKSIMLYPSTAGGKKFLGIKRDVLVKYGSGTILPNRAPSEEDAQSVINLYPKAQQAPADPLPPLPPPPPPPPSASFATGWCGVHVTETSPGISNDFYPHISVEIKDSKGRKIGFADDLNVSNQVSIMSELPVLLLISVDNGVIRFAYGDQTWDSKSEGRCKVGGWDPREVSIFRPSKRQMDCGFTCTAT